MRVDPSHWDQPDTACQPCRGRGWIIVEDDQGLPTVQVTCPYCQGRQTTWWVAVKRSRWFRRFTYRRLFILGLALVLLMTGNAWPSINDGGSDLAAYLFVVHILLFVALLFAWAVSPPRRHVDPRSRYSRRQARHAPGFTDAREIKAVSIAAGAVGLRAAWDQHAHRNQQRGF